MGREALPADVTPDVTTARAYDAVAKVYDEAVSSPRDLAENEMVSRILKDAYRRAPDSPVILDLGCGTGLAIDLLEASPHDYIGIDLSPGMLAVARERHPDHWFEQADMTDCVPNYLPVGMVVSTFGALNHVHPLRMSGLLHDIGDVLLPGGVAVLMYALPRRLRTYVAGGAPAYVYGEWAMKRSLPESLRVTAVRGLTYGRRKPGEGYLSVKRSLLRLRAETWLLSRSVQHADWMILEARKES